MSLEVAPAAEGPGAMLTGQKLLWHMSQLVFFQLGYLIESAPAIVVSVRLKLSVGEQMCVVVAKMVKCFLA